MHTKPLVADPTDNSSFRGSQDLGHFTGNRRSTMGRIAMRRFSLYFVMSMLCLWAVAGESAAKTPGGAAGYMLVANFPGSANLVSPGHNSMTAVQLTSTGSSGWGAIGFTVAKGLKLREVNTLSTDYEFVTGSCWEGSPRFTVGVSNGTTKETWFYMGSPPSFTDCLPGVWANTGNLASPTSPVDDSQLPGGSPSDTYAHAQATYGSYNVEYIAIDLDGGFHATQTVDFDNTQVNGTRYTYEP